jgi:hypothetical protein
MRKLISIIILSLVVFFSCNRKKNKYEIHGKVYVPTNGISGLHDAVWYTDTISFDGDTIYYFNSDGSEVRINPPYILIDKTLDK